MSSIDIWKFLAGLGLFLYGLSFMERATKIIAGRSFKLFLRRNTRNTARAIIGGALITGIIESSSVVILMLMSFVNAGIISFRNAFAVLIGSNLGTTVDSWFIATIGFKFNLQSWSLPVIAITAILMFISEKRKQLYNLIAFFFSIGILLLGFGFMKDGAEQLVIKFNMATYTNYNLFFILLIGFAITVLIQSSSATMAIALTALHTHVLSFPAAACIVIGSEVGTTIKILFSSLTAGTNSRMLAWADFIFNIFTVIISFALLSPIIYLINDIIGIKDPLIGLVFFQSFINLLSILCFLPFLGSFTNLIERIFANKKNPGDPVKQLPVVSELAPGILQNAAEHILERVLNFHKKIFQSGIPTAQAGIIGSLRSFARVHGTTDNEYALIKQAEGDYLHYYSSLNEENFNNKDYKDISRSLASIRQSIHAAKSIHDIQHDLKMFQASANNYLFSQFGLAREDWESFNESYMLLINEKNRHTAIEELSNLKSKAITVFGMHQKATEAALAKGEIKQIDASTLLNVYQEMLSSKKALLRAFALQDADNNE